mmetsp:Transcript_32613/g.70423  ORF Transcript_32613/g.70423 Transcript_32613/m.70423 type:complete len:102 (+) Transcript_32613:103-408(+)
MTKIKATTLSHLHITTAQQQQQSTFEIDASLHMRKENSETIKGKFYSHAIVSPNSPSRARIVYPLPSCSAGVRKRMRMAAGRSRTMTTINDEFRVKDEFER